MSNCRTFNRNRKEQSKPKNVASAEISRLALAKINENPAEFIEKLYEIFTVDKRVLAAALIFKLADGYVLPEPKETGPRKMSLIEKWMSEPQWTPETETAAANSTTESAAVAETATETATEPAAEETAASATESTAPETAATAAAPTPSGVASEIGLAPTSAGGSMERNPGSSPEFRSCRNPVRNVISNPVQSSSLDPDLHQKYFSGTDPAEGSSN
jgi:hypothetical protein